MGNVIDFLPHLGKKRAKEIGETRCKLPFHKRKFVHHGFCYECEVDVQLIQHPSFNKPKWYG
jgi:hypothetical protein